MSKMATGIYQLPSDNYNVKIGFRSYRFNLGTYSTEAKAREAIEVFRNMCANLNDESQYQHVAAQIRDAARQALKKKPTVQCKTPTMRELVRQHAEQIHSLQERLRLTEQRMSTLQEDFRRGQP